MIGNFLTEFIAKCIQEDKNSTNEMCKYAEFRVSEIDTQLEELKSEKANLYSVIRQLGGYKPKPYNEYKNIDFSIPADKLADDYMILCINICKLIEDGSNLTISDIMDKLSDMELIDLEDNERLYFAIKWLSGRNIIDKDNNMLLIKGLDWDKRPNVFKTM